MASTNESGLIDQDIVSITTPAQAEKHYLPLFISGKYDLMGIKKELREIHSFSEKDVSITARILSSAHFRHMQRNPSSNGSVIFEYFQLILGVILFCGGLLAILVLWDFGWISTIPFIIMGSGLTMIFRSDALRKKR